MARTTIQVTEEVPDAELDAAVDEALTASEEETPVDLPEDSAALIALGLGSEFPATRQAAERAALHLSRLRERLTVEESTKAQRDRARTLDEEYRKIQAELARVKAQRAELRGTTPRGSSRDQQIRAWARSQNHPVGDRGRIPQSVIDAYEAVANA